MAARVPLSDYVFLLITVLVIMGSYLLREASAGLIAKFA
jgi:hypothetical protein